VIQIKPVGLDLPFEGPDGASKVRSGDRPGSRQEGEIRNQNEEGKKAAGEGKSLL
jgi:hypothetical protein